jgi:hypothetical protein
VSGPTHPRRPTNPIPKNRPQVNRKRRRTIQVSQASRRTASRRAGRCSGRRKTWTLPPTTCSLPPKVARATTPNRPASNRKKRWRRSLGRSIAWKKRRRSSVRRANRISPGPVSESWPKTPASSPARWVGRLENPKTSRHPPANRSRVNPIRPRRQISSNPPRARKTSSVPSSTCAMPPNAGG